jgi:hypothetical protein
MKLHLTHQPGKPVALTGTGKAGIPSASHHATEKAFSNGGGGCLEAAEVSDGTHAENATAIRTTIKTQKKWFFKTIEVGRRKTMLPHPHTTTAGAQIRARPIVLAALFKYLLDASYYEKYRFIKASGEYAPLCRGGKCVRTPRPNLF